AYEREHTPSLEGFLHWVEQGEQEIKRDLEQGQDRVRIMTVHAAKGLQAPIVILPDTLQTPLPRDRLLWLAEDGGRVDGGRADGGRADGGRADGGRADGGRADGGRADGGRADGGRADGGRADGGRADGGRADEPPLPLWL